MAEPPKVGELIAMRTPEGSGIFDVLAVREDGSMDLLPVVWFSE